MTNAGILTYINNHDCNRRHFCNYFLAFKGEIMLETSYEPYTIAGNSYETFIRI